jgi:hypothetical protein
MAVAAKGIMETVGMVGPTKTPAIYEWAFAWCHREQPKGHTITKPRTRDRVADVLY